jgi:hypothetical protein
MTSNIGKTDKILRIVAGIVVIAAGIAFKAWWGLVGLIPLGTALTGWCPLYVPFKFSTAKKETKTGKA